MPRLARLLLVTSLAALGGACGDGPASASPDAGLPDAAPPDPQVTVLERHDVAPLNAGLIDGAPTVDLAVYVTSGGQVSWSSIAGALESGRAIFGAVGLQIRVVSALGVEVPAAWQSLDPTDAEIPVTPGLLERDLYAHLAEAKERLTARTEGILASIVSHGPAADRERTLHLVTLADVPIGYWEWIDGAWVRRSAPPAGLSMPSYLLEDRISPGIRGVFTISELGADKTLFHEMGHKLINVSHEGATVCPAFAAAGPELMLYGDGTLIGAGAANRWHRERLHQSPYLYETIDDGSGGRKSFNLPYAVGGAYDDPIYGAHVVSPVCGE